MEDDDDDNKDTMPLTKPGHTTGRGSSRGVDFDSCADHDERLRAVEDTMRDLSTIKKLVGGILLLGLPSLGTGLYQTIVNNTNQDQLTAQVAVNDTSLRSYMTAAGEIRSDVRVLVTEFRAAEVRRQDRDEVITERLQRLEATDRAVALRNRAPSNVPALRTP